MRSGLILLALLAACTQSPTAPPSPTASPSAPSSATPSPQGPDVSDGRPRDAVLSIPAIGIGGLRVVAYEGYTDDGPGTEIQNRGVAASPYGAAGGVGPGGIGNYQVTAHRLSSTQAFIDLPNLRNGDRVVVRSGGRSFTYAIVDTRETSFRSPQSLREQRAAVPGAPGKQPTRAYITLSTCATPEDAAAGNTWVDEFGNPEHRIDKIGLLISSR